MKTKFYFVILIVLVMFGSASVIAFADTVSIESVLDTKISQIESQKDDGVVSNRLFSEAALLMNQLKDAVLMSGETPSQAIISLVNRAEQATVGLSGTGVEDLKLAAQSARVAFNMGNFVATEIKEPEVTKTWDNLPKYDATAVKLSDISKHWGKSYIERLVSLGGIKGYSDGTFKPDKTITRAEFLSIAMNSTTKDVSKYPKTFEHWGASVLEAAYDMGIVTTKDIGRTAADLDKAITRQEMALILVRVNENIQKESMGPTSGIKTIMSDYEKVPEYYKSFVTQAYMKGFITGVDTKGTFAGDKLGTRAQAATMVVRLLDKSIRQEPEIDTTKVISEERAPITIYEGKESKLLPRAGDTFVKKDGTKVVLKSIFMNGYEIIAPMQGIAVHTVMKYPDGSYIKNGDGGIMWEDSAHYLGQKYIIDPATGEGHFENDWKLMANYYADRAFAKYGHNAKEGQRFEECKYVYYDSSFGWTWDGPSLAWLE